MPQHPRPLRIAYVLHGHASPGSGVFHKVQSQLNMWRQFGCEARLFVMYRSGGAYTSASDAGITAFRYQSTFDRWSATMAIMKTVMSWRADVVYRRFDLYYPAFEVLARRLPTVLEINSDDVAEGRFGSPARRTYAAVTRGRVLSTASGLVFVTHELAQRPHFARYRVPSIVVSNGVAFRVQAVLPVIKNERPRLVFAATERAEWHGLDKVLALAREVQEWDFDLIGIKPERDDHDSPQNVFYHGYLDRDACVAVIRQADIGIGTLALHRKQMDEACPLKVREYLTEGVPTIVGYQDTDFPQGAPFLLQLPNTEDNVVSGIQRIREFVRDWNGVRVCQDDVAHLSAVHKESDRIAFMARIANRAKIKSDEFTSGPNG